MKNLKSDNLRLTAVVSENSQRRNKIPFRNGTLDFESREFTEEVAQVTLPGNYVKNPDCKVSDLEIFDVFCATMNAHGLIEADCGSDEAATALQRTLGGALFLPNPYPALISISGGAPRIPILEILKIATGDLAIHLGKDAFRQLTNLSPEGVRRLSQARLLTIDMPGRVSQATRDSIVGLLQQTQVTTGINFPALTLPFSAIPVLFTPDENCAKDYAFGDPTAVNQFNNMDDELTSLLFKTRLNLASQPDQIDLFLRWLLDGAYLEREFRSHPENNLLNMLDAPR